MPLTSWKTLGALLKKGNDNCLLWLISPDHIFPSWRFWNYCISYLLLLNKSSQTYWLKATISHTVSGHQKFGICLSQVLWGYCQPKFWLGSASYTSKMVTLAGKLMLTFGGSFRGSLVGNLRTLTRGSVLAYPREVSWESKAQATVSLTA